MLLRISAPMPAILVCNILEIPLISSWSTFILFQDLIKETYTILYRWICALLMIKTLSLLAIISSCAYVGVLAWYWYLIRPNCKTLKYAIKDMSVMSMRARWWLLYLFKYLHRIFNIVLLQLFTTVQHFCGIIGNNTKLRETWYW